MTTRKQALCQWLEGLVKSSDFTLESASEDASFRSYYRLKTASRNFIVMDAPPTHEDCEPFVKVQKILSKQQVHVPAIHGFSAEQGFMLLDDFGQVLLLDVLSEDSVNDLYNKAIDELLLIQSTPISNTVPEYNRELLSTELNLFNDWFIEKHLGLQLNEAQQEVLKSAFEILIGNALEQPQVLVHRDYHSRNIMLCDGRAGIIDFQDAVIGPITYDLASLLKDCYIAWPKETVHQFIELYLTKYQNKFNQELDFSTFLKWFDLMSAQRHMKAIGIFCRLNYRDGKKHYLYDIPRTMNYLLETCDNYEELSDLKQLLSEIQPKINHS